MAIATASVSFSATDTGAATFSPALSTNPAKVLGHGVVVTDSAGPVEISFTNVTNTGATVNASASFTGTVYLVASD